METLDVVLITGRTDKQGVTLEIGKTSMDYYESVAVVELNEEDAEKLGLNENQPVKVETENGAVIVRCKYSKSVKPGLAFMPYGPWTSLLMTHNTEGISMPSYKGVKAKITPQEEKMKVLTIEEILDQFIRG